MTLLKLAWRNVLRNRRRSAITIASIALGLAALTFLWGFVDGMNRQMVENTTRLFAGDLQIHLAGYHDDPTLDLAISDATPALAVVRGHADVAAASVRLEGKALASRGDKSRGVLVVGVAPEEEAQVTRLFDAVVEGRPLGGDAAGVLVGEQLAEALGVRAGDDLVFVGQAYDGSVASGRFVVRGIFRTKIDELDGFVAVMPIDAVREFFAAPGGATAVVLRLKERDRLDAVRAALAPHLGERYEVLGWPKLLPLVAVSYRFHEVVGYVVLLESRSYYGRHRLYRAAVTFSSGNADLRIGRQRIAWGTGRFWSPLDILNPFSPIALEREERIGVDAALAEYKLGALARLSAVYAPQHERRDASAALRWQANTAGIDHALVAGRFARDRVLGADIATQIGDAGLRAELTRTRRAAGDRYWRALIGVDYAFANTLTLGAELYYDGAGASDRQRYDFASLFAGRIQNLGRRYFGGYAGYEITPLLKWNNYFVANLDDRSSYFAPSLVYALRTNLDLTLGAQRFRGGGGSEFARLADAWYAQLQWFF
jgi:hypothetical protein